MTLKDMNMAIAKECSWLADPLGTERHRCARLEEVGILALVQRIEVGAQVRDALDDSQNLRRIHHLALQRHSVQRRH